MNLDPIEVAFKNDKINRAFQRYTMHPKEKYTRPQTSNQEIGWYSRPLMDNKKWERPISSTHITNYVSEYYKLKKVNPFKLPVSTIRMK